MRYLARITKEGTRTLIDFPDCPGCQTFAERKESVAEVAREALEGWLEVHLEDGEAPPRPSSRLRSRGKQASVLPIVVDPSLAVRLQIRWARQAANLSQGDLAKRVGVTRQQISLIESQGGNITLGTLEKIAKALGTDVEVDLVAAGG